jgi:hypothetical protein
LRIPSLESTGPPPPQVEAFPLFEVLDGKTRAHSHCRFVLPLIHLVPYSLRDSVPLFLKRQCGRTLGKTSADYVQRVEPSVTGGRKMAKALFARLHPPA